MSDTGGSGAITVFSVNGVKEVLGTLSERFRQESGAEVRLRFGTIGAIEKWIETGELPDVLVVMSSAMIKAEEQGIIAKGVATEIGRTGLGIVVRQGAPPPDVSSAKVFRDALLGCTSFAYTDPKTGAASGIAIAQILDQLGIAERVKGKAILVGGGSVGEVVAEGGAELGIQQVTELLPVKGITLLPSFPAELQRVTIYHAAVVRHGALPANATRFVKFISGAEAKPAFDSAGFGRY